MMPHFLIYEILKDFEWDNVERTKTWSHFFSLLFSHTFPPKHGLVQTTLESPAVHKTTLSGLYRMEEWRSGVDWIWHLAVNTLSLVCCIAGGVIRHWLNCSLFALCSLH